MIEKLGRKIIIAGSLSNARKYALSEASRGNALYNLELVTPQIIVSENLDKRMISDKEACQIIFKLIKSNNYDLRNNVLTIGATSKLLEIVNDYRLSLKNDYKFIINGKYDELLKDYIKYLDDNNLVDYIYGLEKLNINMKSIEAYKLNDLYLSPLEEKVFNNIFKSIEEIHPKDINNNIVDSFPCYGISNEIYNVLDYIEKNKLNINDCEIVYTSDVYENLLRSILDSRNINYSITGAHAKSTNIVTFMLDILDYIKNDYKYELLEEILKNKGLESIYLKEFYKTLIFPTYTVGYGRERTEEFLSSSDLDKRPNIKEFLQDLLAFGYDENFDYNMFLKFTYKYINNGNEKQYLSNKLNNLIYVINASDNKIDEAIKELSSLRYSEEDNNALQLSLLNKTFSLKKDLFIIGLSQNYVSGADIENPFIIDIDEYYKYLGQTKNLHVLYNTRNINTESLDYYINYSNSKIHMSYSFFNKIDFRPSAPSVYYLIKGGISFDEKNGINKYDISKNAIKFNKKQINNIINIENDNYDNGIIKELDDKKKHIDIDNNQMIIKDVEDKHDYHISPSALQTLFECPFRYYYEKIVHLPNPNYPKLGDDCWLEQNSKGTFFHRILELYADQALMKDNYINHLSDEIFNDSFNKALEETIKLNPIKNESFARDEQEEIKELAINKINDIIKDFNETGYRVLACEYSLEETGYSHNGISFSGSIDRVDGKIENNILHIRIVDYKTGVYKEKKDSLYLQHAIYSVCLRDTDKKDLFGYKYDGIIVDEFIYDYAFENESNVYDKEEIDLSINEVFETMDSLLNNYINGNNCYEEFNDYFNNKNDALEKVSSSTKTLCDYCKYKDVCIKRLEEGKEWKR